MYMYTCFAMNDSEIHISYINLNGNVFLQLVVQCNHSKIRIKRKPHICLRTNLKCFNLKEINGYVFSTANCTMQSLQVRFV